jgi:beta-glucanase (GH16 family)
MSISTKLLIQITAIVGLLGSLYGQDLRYFPQVGDGTAGSISFRTSVVFVNTGTDAVVEIDFLTEASSPLELELPPFGRNSTFSIPLAAGKSLASQTPGTGTIQVGYARFRAPETVGATAVFTGVDAGSGTVLFEAGVPASSPLSSFNVFLDSLEELDTGLAVVATETSAAPAAVPADSSFTITLYDKDYQQIDTREVPLQPGKKLAQFVHQFFEGNARTEAMEMQGHVSVSGQGISLAAVTLRQRLSKAFPEEVPTLTTFPVIPGTDLKWNLVWSDEFSGSALDLAKWEYQMGNGCPSLCGWGNNEREFYTDRPENVRLEDGKLIIEARRDRTDVIYPYSSGRIRTKGKGDWKYGRFEIRAKLPFGQGIWPAFWMLPTDEIYGTWAASGEIDIMEMVGHRPNRVHGTLHHGAQWPNNDQSGGAYTLRSGDFSQDFHVFVLEWAEDEMHWFVDEVLYYTQQGWSTQGHPYPAPFDQSFHLLLNLAVGGNWPGLPDSSTVFPQRVEVDYVRVYQLAP